MTSSLDGVSCQTVIFYVESIKFNMTRMCKHIPFIARTVLVQNGQIDEAFRVLNRIMGQEGLLDIYRRTRYFEKPFQARKRINFETCKSIYNEDMSRKISFVMRKNRLDPWPGCK